MNWSDIFLMEGEAETLSKEKTLPTLSLMNNWKPGMKRTQDILKDLVTNGHGSDSQSNRHYNEWNLKNMRNIRRTTLLWGRRYHTYKATWKILYGRLYGRRAGIVVEKKAQAGFNVEINSGNGKDKSRISSSG